MNAYQLLQVNAGTPLYEVKKTWRLLSQINHPDRNPLPNADEVMRAINSAYNYIVKGGRRPPVFSDDLHVYRSREELKAATSGALSYSYSNMEREVFRRSTVFEKYWVLGSVMGAPMARKQGSYRKPVRRSLTKQLLKYLNGYGMDCVLFNVNNAACLLGITKKQVRNAIDQLRKQGHTIEKSTSQRGCFYWYK